MFWNQIRDSYTWNWSPQYSAMSGSRKAALLQDMWTVKVSEGEDPKPYMARIRSSHVQITAGGMALSDEMLAYAMKICNDHGAPRVICNPQEKP